uniref:Uncharacterized protein n=1 Tax=Rhizophora mucronata TaxID=61149 RepID=A0A2P2LQC1_RHIMU
MCNYSHHWKCVRKRSHFGSICIAISVGICFHKHT